MAKKAGITREDVVAAAVEVADTDGLDAVTLAAVAARLRIRSPSLYSHVDGLDGLRRDLALEAAARMAGALEAAVGGRTGVDALAALAAGYRDFSRRHPGLYQAAQRAVRPGEDDELYRALAGVVMPAFRALGEAGVPPAEQVHAARAIRSALHGFVALEQGGGFGMPDSVEESFRRMVSLLVAAVRATARAPVSDRQ